MRLPGGWGETNIGLVAGAGASLLIDTPWDRPLTRAMLDALAPATDRAPVATVFHTHPDPDHWWGNSEVPGAEVLAAAAAAQAMRDEPTPGRLAGLRRASQVGARIPRRAGLGARYVAGVLAPFAFDDVHPRLPERTFTERRVETVGGTTVELIEIGAAHTVSDSIVLVPDARVAYTGDLLFAGVTPVMWHGPVDQWLAALDRLIALDADVFIPGHGAISTRLELRALHSYWAWLKHAVHEHAAAGHGTLETAKLLTATREYHAFRAWECPERLYVNVATIERELAGEGPLPTDPLTRARVFDGVARLSHHVRHQQ